MDVLECLRCRTAGWIFPNADVLAVVRPDDGRTLDPRLPNASRAGERRGTRFRGAAPADGELIDRRRRLPRIPDRHVRAVPLHLTGALDLLIDGEVRQRLRAVREL